MVEFHKYEGLGNDFVLIDREALGQRPFGPEQAIALCDRHRGVGGDGVLLVGLGAPSMGVINADGSVPEMCGNGIRCVALHLARRVDRSTLALDIETAAGAQRCDVERKENHGEVTAQMNAASFAPEKIGLQAQAPWIDAPIRVQGRELCITAVSVGNPHAVIFDEVGDARFEIGEALQRDARFANGVNVGFVSALGTDHMRLDVLERGAGWTQACGTGAAAAAAAAVETGRVSRGTPLRVRLPGGTLTMTAHSTGVAVQMRGPARFIFRGEIDLDA